MQATDSLVFAVHLSEEEGLVAAKTYFGAELSGLERFELRELPVGVFFGGLAVERLLRVDKALGVDGRVLDPLSRDNRI